MNALPSIEPPPHPRKPQKSTVLNQPNTAPVKAGTSSHGSTRQRSRVKSNPAYAHRRQGLEVFTKLATYSVLSMFGIVTLVNLGYYNWSQQSKLQHLDTELKDAQTRTDKINNSFNRSFDLQLRKNVMQENTYKIAPDQRPIFVVTPPVAQSSPSSQPHKTATK